MTARNPASHFPWLLPECQLLTEADSIALLGQIQQQAIETSACAQPVLTSYVHQGQGKPPLLLLHGFDSSLLEFRSIVPLLARHRSLWAVDLLGFGFTQRPDSVPINPTMIRQHLFAFWQRLVGDPVILVGASMGGAVAIDFALTHPQAVAKLVLIDSVGYSGSFAIGQLLFPPFDCLATEWLRYRKLMALHAVAASQPPNLPLLDAIRCSLLHQSLPGWNAAIASFTRSGGYSELEPRVAQVRHPTLILWGKSDDVLGTADAVRFQQAIVHSRLVWMQCGHVPHLEQPQATAQRILDFTGC